MSPSLSGGMFQSNFRWWSPPPVSMMRLTRIIMMMAQVWEWTCCISQSLPFSLETRGSLLAGLQLYWKIFNQILFHLIINISRSMDDVAQIGMKEKLKDETNRRQMCDEWSVNKTQLQIEWASLSSSSYTQTEHNKIHVPKKDERQGFNPSLSKGQNLIWKGLP